MEGSATLFGKHKTRGIKGSQELFRSYTELTIEIRNVGQWIQAFAAVAGSLFETLRPAISSLREMSIDRLVFTGEVCAARKDENVDDVVRADE